VLWFVCKELLERIGKLIDHFVDDTSSETKLLVARRRKVTTKMKMLLSKGMNKELSEPSRRPTKEAEGPPELNPRASELFERADAGAQRHLDEQEIWREVEVEEDAHVGHQPRSSRGPATATASSWVLPHGQPSRRSLHSRAS